MFEIITIENILTGEHTRKAYPYGGKRLIDIVDIRDLQVYVNGVPVVIPYSYIPQDGDQVILTAELEGGMKGALGWILQIGLMVAAPYVGGWLGITSKFGQALAAGAFMILGGKIVNSLCHVNQQHPVEQEKSPTYGWDLPQVQTREGGLIGETYGEAMPSGQLLMYHVETETETFSRAGMSFNRTHAYSGEKDVQYLNVLYSGGYGPVDSIDDIRIGYTPIGNFEGVQIEKRLGTNDQEPISFFPNAVADQSIGMDCKQGTSVIRSTDSDQCNAVEVTVTWPGGIYSVKDDGNFDNLTVRFNIGIRRTGSEESWMDQPCEVTQKVNSTVRRSYKFENLPAGRYDVRVLAVDMPITSRKYAQMQWALLSTYINSGRFSRPNKVLIALRIKATNQLNNGIPALNWRQRRLYVLVFNPRTRKYEEKSARNPIWAAYDILHHCRRLKNISTGQYEYVVDGCPADRFAKYFDEWQQAADYADEMVDNGEGGRERRFEFDAFYDTNQKRFEAANKAANVGHATLVRHGINLGIVVDKPGSVKQLFGEGRTTMSSFTGNFSSREERARSVQITYNDEQRDYKNTEFFVRSPRYAENRNLQDNTANVTLFGVSRRSQAHREALYYLATNERQLQTIKLSADVNALVCEYGDLIGVSHSVPRLGMESGRLVSISGTTIKLDKKVTLTASEPYSIIVQRSADDVLITRDLVAVADEVTTDTVTVAQGFGTDEAPAPYDCYAVGIRDRVVKPFRVVKLEQDKDLKMTITATEYDPAVYETDYSRYPIIDYSKGKASLLKAPINLKLTEVNARVPGGSKNSTIHAQWDMPEGARYDSFRVTYSTDSYNWTDGPVVRGLSADIDDVDPNYTYYVRVRAVLDGLESAYVTGHIGLTGNILPAVPVTGLTAHTRYRQITGQTAYDVIVNWLPADAVGRVYYKTSYTAAEDVVGAAQSPWSAWVYAGQGAGQLVIPQLLPGETVRIAVVTANELGEYVLPDSVAHIDTIVAQQSTTPLAPEGFELVFEDRAVAKWQEVTNTDIAYYELRTNNAPGEAPGLLVQTTDLQAAAPLTERQGTIFLFAKNTQGTYSAAAQLSYKKDAPKAPKPPKVTAGIGTLSVVADPLPAGCTAMAIRIKGTKSDVSLRLTSNVLVYPCDTDIYDVSVAFVDLFGPGAASGTTTVSVKAKIDGSLLDKESLGLAKIDENIAKLEAAVGVVKTDVSGLSTKLTQTAEGLQQSVTDLTNDVHTQITQISDSIDLRISEGLKGLDGDGLITRINLSTSGVRIDGKLLHVTGQALFDDNIVTSKMLQASSVTADKLQVDSLDAISARIGVLRTATSGARTEIKDNVVETYDDDDMLRVRIGGPW